MNIYRLWPEEDFQELVPVRETIAFDRPLHGERLADRWRSVEMKVHQPSSGLLKPDICASLANTIVTAAARDALADLFEGAAELLPLHGKPGQHFLVNVILLLPALDETASQAFRFSDGRIGDISRYVIDEAAIGDANVFKLSAFPEGDMLVTDEFAERVFQRRLKGVWFGRVWPDGGRLHAEGGGLWDNVSAQTPTASRDELLLLSPEARAWYATGLFERVAEADGLGAFFGRHGEIVPLVGPAYLLLGLSSAAEAFEDLRRSHAVKQLMQDETYEPREDEWAMLERWDRRIGRHDGDRIAFVRSHPDAFAQYLPSGTRIGRDERRG